MNTQATRQKLINAIADLPSEALLELTYFIDYLRYKSIRTPPIPQTNPASAPSDVSILPELPFYQRATSEEWTETFLEWIETHKKMNHPILSDDAISRESIYGERG
ncbi:MAG TPA: hypothetical protein DEG17_12450 [Cyanobacteria bacterium UBA11149]|nr:hypothetical protein [Cyanobacteria bacterium UBA11367]HBE59989.1 hypothetical protein [Cyanobacteria bacterium UBA11366]HBK63943.1 hypothetical protein [Cyanobacteria bacterium UBA11166]HBR75245.1 hypothetical protein [Cyanobacteria bacterium UBA11159]HBS70513.1 hypothetical protein [Cyanobacteria bacterium UBA11153]HBW89656.1 hypothetical protein [Cyanobacteria bacterium UBA11149]HCA96809.1 hypothetical protein [Cyanobacteria bacterium UBA9226]